MIEGAFHERTPAVTSTSPARPSFRGCLPLDLTRDDWDRHPDGSDPSTDSRFHGVREPGGLPQTDCSLDRYVRFLSLEVVE